MEYLTFGLGFAALLTWGAGWMWLSRAWGDMSGGSRAMTMLLLLVIPPVGVLLALDSVLYALWKARQAQDSIESARANIAAGPPALPSHPRPPQPLYVNDVCPHCWHQSIHDQSTLGDPIACPKCGKMHRIGGKAAGPVRRKA